MNSIQPPGTKRFNAAPTLYMITPDRPAKHILGPVADVVAAVDVVVQVRCKSVSEDEFVYLAQQVTDLCHDANRTCIINDRLDIAVAVGADGVHLGQSDMGIAQARKHFDGILGSTCRTIDQAQAAVRDGADYLGVGPTFISSTKTGLPEPLGVSGVSQIADVVDIPVYAIGGITSTTAPMFNQTNVHGVAVVAAIFSQPSSACSNAEKLVRALSGEAHQRCAT